VVFTNQTEFGSNWAVDKHIKISVEIRVSADLIGGPIYIGRSLIQGVLLKVYFPQKVYKIKQ